MLPDFLLRLLISFTSYAVPSYCAFHSTAIGDTVSHQRWLFYLCIYVVLNYFIFPLIEPVMLAIQSVLPFGLYYEAKLLFYVALVLPRFGALDRMMELTDSNFVVAKKKIVTQCETGFEKCKEKAGDLQNRLQATIAKEMSPRK